MILRDNIRCSHSVNVSYVPSRSTPMKSMFAYYRPCRILLFICALLLATPAAHADNLEDSAKELAGKITMAVAKPGDLSCEIRNRSTLDEGDVIRIDQALKTELQGRCVRTLANGSEVANLVVTLSENIKGLVWTAEIHQAEGARILMLDVSRPAKPTASIAAFPMTVRAERIWEGPEQIIDVAFVAVPSAEQKMVLLEPEGLIITKSTAGNSAASQNVQFPPAEALDREPTGDLKIVGNQVEATTGGRVCAVNLDTGVLDRCYVPPVQENGAAATSNTNESDHSDQAKTLLGSCGIDSPVLVSGTGDYTQPDSAQMFKDKTAISNELNFPGPILRISQGSDAQVATAIVHNLKDGNYEAIRLSIACGQ
jgi:hypothetical protein